MRVLGVDPGTIVTGWGVVDDRSNGFRRIDSGVIRGRGELPARLANIHKRVVELLEKYSPSFLSLEKTFVGSNVQSAFRLGEARGAILVAAAQRDVPVVEYSPAEIKVAVAGAGRATKDQVQLMVSRLLNITGPLVADESDALASAICHLHSNRFAALVAIERPRRRSANARKEWERLARERS